jgi:two-component system, LytTR family, response regulator
MTDNNNHSSRRIRVLIVDDEEEARNLLERLLQRLPDAEILGKAASADEALEMAIDLKPDMVFLDVQMPEKDGFHLVNYFQRFLIDTKVVFVTAHAEFAINAVKVSAFDYLLKPVMMNELHDTIIRFKAGRLHGQKAQPQGMITAAEPLPAKLKFNTRTGYILISPEEIMYCEADVNYTSIYLGKDNREVVTINLGKIEEMLAPYMFFRISRSVLINQHYLSKADRQKKQCLLNRDNERIILDISPNHIRELEHYLDGLTQ